MRLGIQLGIVFLLGLVLAFLLPWWSIAISGFVGGFLIHGHRGRSFLGGFLGAWILWSGAALLMQWTTGSALPDMFAMLISPAINGIVLALISGVVAGLVAGFAAFTGDAVQRLVFPGNVGNARR